MLTLILAVMIAVQLLALAARAEVRPGIQPTATVRTCSDSDTPADRDFLPILAIRGGQPNLFLFKTVLSSSRPYQYVRDCDSGDFGVTWTGSGSPIGANGNVLMNFTWGADYPDSREIFTAEVWQPGSPNHILWGPWLPVDPPWSYNASGASAAIALSSPHYAILAFQRGSPPSVFFMRSGDYWGFSGFFTNWTTPFKVAGAIGPTGPEPSGNPSLAVDPENRIHLVYLRSDVTGRRDVYYLRNDDRGRDDGWTPEPGRLLSPMTADNHDAVIATSRQGQAVVVVWTATLASGDDDLMYAYSLDGGLTWGSTASLAATAYHEENAVIAVDPVASSFHVAYWRDDSTPAHHNNILYTQAAWGDPANWTTPLSVVDTGAIVSDTYRRPAITSYWRGGTNHIVSVAWTDLRNVDEDIYMTDLDFLECAANATPTSGLAPLVVSFAATASGGMPPYNYSWSYGDGAIDRGAAVVHAYATPGTYGASLAVTDGAGATCFAGVPIDVLSPLPDLAVFRSEIVLSASPYVAGDPLAVHAVVRNLGGGNATNATIRLALGGPAGPSLADQVLPSLPSRGNASVTFPWTPPSAGPYTLCVVADPDNTISESNEGNNDACVSLDVAGKPDVAILSGDVTAVPSAVPLGGTIDVHAIVRNLGSQDLASVRVAFFADLNGNRAPDAGEAFDAQTIPSLAGGATTPLTATWTANALGLQTVCAAGDPNGTIAEADETNNIACTAVAVQGPPDYVLVNPTPSSPALFGLSRTGTFSIDVRNAGGAAANVTVRLSFFNASAPSIPFAAFDVPPLGIGGEAGPFAASWVSPSVPGTYTVTAIVDPDYVLAEGNESNNAFSWTVQVVAAPVTTLVVGTPSVLSGLRYITAATPLSFSVFDPGGSGVGRTDYRIDLGPWINYTATGPFHLAADGTHALDWFSVDNAGNTELTASALLGVDNTPPATTVGFGSPKYPGPPLFVTSATLVNLSSVDGGVTPVGLASTEYRTNGGVWTVFSAPFTLGGADGPRTVEYRATDLLGNSAGSAVNVTLDDTPPVTTITPAAGPFATDTVFALAATDGGSGVDGIEYRIDGGPWSPYLNGFSLASGDHVIGFRAIDHLQNRELEHTLSVSIEGPRISAAMNWKPLVAAAFAAILAATGIWASIRAPWRGTRPRTRAFAYTSLPFVATEAGTGVLSAWTGLLAIPPALGLGSVLDSIILVAGILVAAIRVLRRTPGV